MIGDGPVIETQFVCMRRDGFQRIASVGPIGMVVQRTPQVGPLDESRQRIRLGRGKFPVIFAQLGRHVSQPQILEDFPFFAADDS